MKTGITDREGIELELGDNLKHAITTDRATVVFGNYRGQYGGEENSGFYLKSMLRKNEFYYSPLTKELANVYQKIRNGK